MKSVSKNQKWLYGFTAILWIYVTPFIQSNAAAEVCDGSPVSMPVKEITIFKDGHAFVMHEGKRPPI